MFPRRRRDARPSRASAASGSAAPRPGRPIIAHPGLSTFNPTETWVPAARNATPAPAHSMASGPESVQVMVTLGAPGCSLMAEDIMPEDQCQ
jgi:hypothetical protein